MKPRWYIGILIVTLTLLGSIASEQQVTIPNQEIVLQFASDNVTSDDANNAIAIVTEQLQSAGIDQIQVKKLQGGQLKISYYSATDVASIKALLSAENSTELDYIAHNQKQTKVPYEDQIIDFDLDVYEIQKGSDVSDIDGKLALETKAEHERFSNPNVFTPLETFNLDTKERVEKVAYKFRKSIAISIDNNSFEIPEVRAGPWV